MSQFILIIHVLVAIALIALILLQHGKGADAGAAFGSGASNTMFGSVGSMPFLMKITALLAALFFATSMILAYLASHQKNVANQFEGMQMPSIPASQTKNLTPSTTTPTPKKLAAPPANQNEGNH